jgi:alkylation response protein AidB-like acyl-CoA dehydrogenase
MQQENETMTRTDTPQSEGDAASLISSAAENLKNRAAEAVRDTAVDYAEQRKREGAERIKDFGRAVHGAADEIGKEIPQAAEYVHSAASRIESAADELRNRSLEELISGFTRFARQQPAAAFAGAVLAGFVLSRFLKTAR